MVTDKLKLAENAFQGGIVPLLTITRGFVDSGHRKEAQAALSQLMHVEEPDAKAAMISALYASHSPQFESYAEKELSNTEQYVQDSAKLVLGIYRTKGFKP